MASKPSNTITARLHWAEHLAIWAAVAALLFDVGWNIVVERPIQREEAVVRAWQVLLTPSLANSGKGQAMSVLAARGQPLNNVDLSCETMARQLGRELDICDFSSPSIFNLNLDYPRPSVGQGSEDGFFDGRLRAYMRGLNLSQNEVWDPVFANLVVHEVTMDETQLFGFNAENMLIQFSSARSMVIGEARWLDVIASNDISGSSISFHEATNVVFDNVRAQDLDLSNIALPDPDSPEVPTTNRNAGIRFDYGDLSSATIDLTDYSEFELFGTNVSDTLFVCNTEERVCLSQLQRVLSLAWARPDQPPTYAPMGWFGDTDPPTIPRFRNFCNHTPSAVDAEQLPRFEGQGAVTFPRLVVVRPDLCTLYIDFFGSTTG